MGVNWERVRKQHVTEACQLILAGGLGRKHTARGLFVLFQGRRLPAKDVARIAHQLAAGRQPDEPLKFASGQGTLDLLTRLGFQVERVSANRGTAS
jgi:hypothetical protein